MSTNLDQVASGLASGTITRRRALAAIGAGALGTLLPWASKAQADPKCRKEGHPCEGNQECCSGLVCSEKGGAGPGKAKRCVKPEDEKCDKTKSCDNDKDCKTHGDDYECSCTEKVVVKKEECDPRKPKCDKGCECKYDKTSKKYYCVCKVEKNYCLCKEEKHYCKKAKKH